MFLQYSDSLQILWSRLTAMVLTLFTLAVFVPKLYSSGNTDSFTVCVRKKGPNHFIRVDIKFYYLKQYTREYMNLVR